MRLIDINDNPPEFEHSTYTSTVPEDTSVGSSVMQVFATSRDTGINAEISYDIIAGNEQNKFRMDSKTGERRGTVASALNSEERQLQGKTSPKGFCEHGRA